MKCTSNLLSMSQRLSIGDDDRSVSPLASAFIACSKARVILFPYVVNLEHVCSTVEYIYALEIR